MEPGKLNLPTVWRGSNYAIITMRWLDQDGTPIDLTGLTAVAKSKQIDFNATVVDAPNGYTQISLTSEQTADLDLGVEQWDWLFLNVDNEPFFPGPLISGYVEIKEPVSVISPIPVPS